MFGPCKIQNCHSSKHLRIHDPSHVSLRKHTLNTWCPSQLQRLQSVYFYFLFPCSKSTSFCSQKDGKRFCFIDNRCLKKPMNILNVILIHVLFYFKNTVFYTIIAFYKVNAYFYSLILCFYGRCPIYRSI